jgi:tripartite-type tricarboxylate transporter receptor subunit TctC
MVGAAGLASANWLAHVAPRDGSVIATFAHSVTVEPLLGAGAGKFDPTKFNWIGNMDAVTGVCALATSAGIGRAQDLMTREVIVGASGAGVGGPLSQSPRALRNLLGMKLKLIQGYKGSADVRLAIQRGEVQGICGLPLSTLKTEWRDDFDNKRIVPVLQLGLNKSPELPGIAHVYDFAKSEKDRQTLDLVFGAQANGRPFAAPPETPGERVKALREAFQATVADAEFRAEAKKLSLDLNPSSGEEVGALIAKFFDYPRAVIEGARAAVSTN